MPYRVGGKGDTAGCAGYAVLDENGKAVGCHATRAEADNHMQALYANVPDAEKADVAGATPSFTIDPKYPGAGIKRPEQGRGGKGVTGSGADGSKYGKLPKKKKKGSHADANYGASGAVASGGSGGSMGTL